MLAGQRIEQRIDRSLVREGTGFGPARRPDRSGTTSLDEQANVLVSADENVVVAAGAVDER
jgi:hypothetical protein